MDLRIRRISGLLEAEKARERRQGLKELAEQLDSPSMQSVLDINTAKMLPSERIKPVTWPGLIDATLRAFEAERKSRLTGSAKGGAASSSRAAPGGDPFGTNAAKQLKKLLQCADNEQRSGRRGVLARRATKLFEFVADALGVPGVLATPAASDYIAILRHNLLSGPPEYAALSSIDVFQDLMACIMGRLDELQQQQQQQRTDAEAVLGSRSGDGGGMQQRMGLAAAVAAAANEGGLSAQQAEEASRLLNTLAQLISATPGDLAPKWRGRLGAFWSRLVGWLADCRDVGRLALAALVGINATLLIEGPDFGNRRAATLYQSARPFLRRVWAEQRPLPRLKEALAVYILSTLLLGGLSGPERALTASAGEEDLLQELWGLLAKDIDTQAVKWWDGMVDMSGVAHVTSQRTAQGASPFSCPPISRQSLPLAQLAAACMAHRQRQYISQCALAQMGGGVYQGGGVHCAGPGVDACEPPTKRQRTGGLGVSARGGGDSGGPGLAASVGVSPVERLARRLEQAPSHWAPVAGLLVAQHPHVLALTIATTYTAHTHPAPVTLQPGSSLTKACSCAAAQGASMRSTAGGVDEGCGGAQPVHRGVAYFGPLLHTCVPKLVSLLRDGAHLRPAAPAGASGGVEGPTLSARTSSAAVDLVWLLRCLCELAQAMGPMMVGGCEDDVVSSSSSSSSSSSDFAGVSSSGGSLGLSNGGWGWQQGLSAASAAWQKAVDAVAQGFNGSGVQGGEPDALSQDLQCVPTLLAAEMATFLVIACETGVSAPSMPPHQLLWGALQSAGSRSVAVTTGLAATLLRPPRGLGLSHTGAGVDAIASGDSQQEIALRQTVLNVCQELAESPFLVGALGPPACPPTSLGSLPAMSKGALGTAARTSAEATVAMLDLDVPAAGLQQQGLLDVHPPFPHDHIWGSSGCKQAHGPRTHALPLAPSYHTSASPYAPWLLIAQPQAPGWTHTQGKAGLPVVGEEILELPAWACSADDDDVIGMQRKLSLLIHGADRSARAAHFARLAQHAKHTEGSGKSSAYGAGGAMSMATCVPHPPRLSAAVRLQLRLQVLAQFALDLAALHVALGNTVQHGMPSAQELLRIGGLVLLVSEAAAATATDLVADACMGGQQQSTPGEHGRAGSASTPGEGSLVGLAAADLMDSYGLSRGSVPGGAIAGTVEPQSTARTASRACSEQVLEGPAATGGGSGTGRIVRQLLGLLLGPSSVWGLVEEEDGRGGSVAAIAAAAAAATKGGSQSGAPKVAWGVASLVVAGLPQLLGAAAHGLASMVAEVVADAALQPAGAAAALAAVSASAGHISSLLSHIAPSLRQLASAAFSLHTHANTALQHQLHLPSPHTDQQQNQQVPSVVSEQKRQQEVRQQLLQTIQGAGATQAHHASDLARRPARRALPSSFGSLEGPSISRLCADGLCSQQELRQPLMESINLVMEECVGHMFQLAERASEVAQEKLDAETRASAVPMPAPELDDDLDMGTTSSLATRPHAPVRDTQVTGAGASDGARGGALGGGTQFMTPMPSMTRAGLSGVTHASMATLGGFSGTSSSVIAAVAVGVDPLTHAQQLLLGVMAALAPAHGGAAAATGLHAWEHLWGQAMAAPSSDLLEGLAGIVAAAVARDPCVGPEGMLLAARMLAPDLQSEEEGLLQGARQAGGAKAPAHILSFKSMTAERILFVLEGLRCMIAAAGHRFQSPPTSATTNTTSQAVNTDAPAEGTPRGSLRGLFDGDSISPVRPFIQAGPSNPPVTGAAVLDGLENALVVAAREAEKLRERAHASDSLISDADAWGDIDFEHWGPGVNPEDPVASHSHVEEEELDIEGNGPWGSAWRLRAAVGAAVGDMIRLDSRRAEDNEALRVLMEQRAVPLMKDRRHHARMAGAGFASRVLLVSWEDSAAIYEDVIQPALHTNGTRCLSGSAEDPHGHAPSTVHPSPPPEVVATSVALLVECAHACGAQEVEALAACLEHASQVPGDAHIVANGLEELASRLGYGCSALTGMVCRPHTPVEPSGRPDGGAQMAPALPLCVAGAGLALYLDAHILPFSFRWFRTNSPKSPTPPAEVMLRIQSLQLVTPIINGTALFAPSAALSAGGSSGNGAAAAAAAQASGPGELREEPLPPISTAETCPQGVVRAAAQIAAQLFVQRYSGALFAALLQVNGHPTSQETATAALIDAAGNAGPPLSPRDLLVLHFPLLLATSLPGDFHHNRAAQVISGPMYEKYVTQQEQDNLLTQLLPLVASQIMLVSQYAAKYVDGYLMQLSKTPKQQQQHQPGPSQFVSPSRFLQRPVPSAQATMTLTRDQEQQLQHLGDPGADRLGCRDPELVQPPLFGVEDAVYALVVRVCAAGQEKEGWLFGEQMIFDCLTGADLAMVLLDSHRHVTAVLPCPRHALQRLASLRAIIALMGWRVAEPATCRYLVQILLQLLPHTPLQRVVLRMLDSVIHSLILLAYPDGQGLSAAEAAEGERLRAGMARTATECWPAVTQQGARSTLLSVVQALASCLSQAAEEASALHAHSLAVTQCVGSSGVVAVAGLRAVGAQGDRDALVRLLRKATLTQQLMEAAAEEGQGSFALSLLGSLDALPALPGLQKAVHMQQALKAHVTLPEELHHVLLRIRGMSHAARTRALSALKMSLCTRWQEIYVQPLTTPDPAYSTAGTQPEVRSDVVRCAWKLAALAAELAPDGGDHRADGNGHMLATIAGMLLAAASASKKLDSLTLGNPAGAASPGTALLSGSESSAAQTSHNPPLGPSSIPSSAATGRRRGNVEAHSASAATTRSAAAGGGYMIGAGVVGGPEVGVSLGLGPSMGLPVLVRVLEILDGCLVEVGDTRVISAAQATTRALLGTKNGSDALSAMQAAEMGTSTGAKPGSRTHVASRAAETECPPVPGAGTHLAVYARRSAQLDTAQSEAHAMPQQPADLSDPSLWSCSVKHTHSKQAAAEEGSGQQAGAHSFDAWLCRLAGALISHCKDPLLHMMHGIVVLKASLAELLLPEILRNLLLYAGPGEIMLPEIVAECLSKHVLEPAAASVAELHSVPDILDLPSVRAPSTAHDMDVDNADKDPNALPGQTPTKQPPPQCIQSAAEPPADAASRTGGVIFGGRDSAAAPLSQPLRRAVRLVVSCLEELRLLHIREVVETEGKTRNSKGKASLLEPGYEPQLWLRCYFLNLDYLLVAKAAFSVQAYLTSFVYTEYWVKHCQDGTLRKGLSNLLKAADQHHQLRLHGLQHPQQQQPQPGPLRDAAVLHDADMSPGGACTDPTLLPFLVLNTPPPAAAAAAAPGEKRQQQKGGADKDVVMPKHQAAQAEAVLRLIWGSSSDPDVLHALAGQGKAGTEELLMLMEREGNWPGAFAAYDLALAHHNPTPKAGACMPHSAVLSRPAASQQQHLQQHAQGGGAAADVSRMRYGVAIALDRMGCGCAAATYLQGTIMEGALVPPGTLQSKATHNLQYELAWRLGQWDPVALQQGVPEGGLGGNFWAQQESALVGDRFRDSSSSNVSSQALGGAPAGFQLPSRLDLSSCMPAMHEQPRLNLSMSCSRGIFKQPGQMDFHESLLACLCALQVGDWQRFQSVLRSATTECVRVLACTSNEAPSALDQPLEHLRCLRLLEDVWHVTWSRQSLLSPSPSVHMNVPSTAVDSLQQQLLNQMHALVQGSATSTSPGVQGRLDLARDLVINTGPSRGPGQGSSELLNALRCAALRVSGCPGVLARALASAVSECQAMRSTTHGAAYAQQLRRLLSAAASVPQVQALVSSSAQMGGTQRARAEGVSRAPTGRMDVSEMAQLAAMLRPDAGWRLDEARLTWRSGQRKVAARMACSIADAMLALQTHVKAAAAGAPAQAPPPLQLHAGVTLLPPDPLQLASALSLTGKWGAKTQLEDLGSRGRGGSGGSTTDGALALMTQATQVAGEQLSAWRASLAPQSSSSSSTETAAALRMRTLPGSNPQAFRSSISSPWGSSAACKVFYRLAAFADAQYVEHVAQQSTPEYKAYTRAMVAKRKMADSLKARLIATSPTEQKLRATLNYVINSNMKPVLADEEARKQAAITETRYKSIALSNYKRCLQAGHLYDLHVAYRLVAMWLSLSCDKESNRAFGKAFDELPTHKFVPLVYQMASRISRKKDTEGFQEVLSSLLVRMARDHPFHALYPLYALKNGALHATHMSNDLKVITGGGILTHQADLDKVSAAQSLLDAAAAGGSTRLREIVSQGSEVINAYCDIAAMDKPDRSVGDPPPIAFPQGIWRRMKLATQVAVVSYQLPVDPTCTYADIPYMAATDGKIHYAGGINAPKVVKCFDQHGTLHKQLVKSGSDDTRQDAVMQQFFGLVNALLAQDREACKRQLGMVCYKVVPFSPIAGLIEWVQGTMAMSEYLIGPHRNAGAHGRHGKPGQPSYKAIAQKYMAGQSLPADQRIASFNTILASFPPVMHHFFLESFPQPATWFSARTTYTRSVAVTSMAGWLIGLGDRHSSNILLDTRTAAVVHIDLGVAFEQGRFLHTPELVPFRLTQDVVDGCGIAGVEGPLRRCCEGTLRVLRSSKEALLQVVEVFIHDPLFKWALSHGKAQKRQQEDRHAGSTANDEQQALALMQQQQASGPVAAGQVVGNADAERAVLRVKQKLEGLDTSSTARGVEAQVSSLLAESQDPERLSRMFYGWASWL